MRACRTPRAHRRRLIVAAQTIGHLRWRRTGIGSVVLGVEMRAEVTAPAIRVFRGIAKAWRMTFTEQLRLLGLPRPIGSRCLRGDPPVLPAETLKQIALIARVFEAINVLLPSERADAWMRAPNAASIFGGRSALECMMQDGRYGIFMTRQYLLAQIYR